MLAEEIIKKLGENIPLEDTSLILVGTKVEESSRQVSNKQANQLAAKYNCFYFDGELVDKIFTTLTMDLIAQRERTSFVEQKEAKCVIN